MAYKLYTPAKEQKKKQNIFESIVYFIYIFLSKKQRPRVAKDLTHGDCGVYPYRGKWLLARCDALSRAKANLSDGNT